MEDLYFYELHLSTRKLLVRVFYTCSVWFNLSEPVRTIPQIKQTPGEGVLHMFGGLTPRRGRNPTRSVFLRCNVVLKGSEGSNHTEHRYNTLTKCLLALRCSSKRFGGFKPHRTRVEHAHQEFACAEV